jgi:putative tryptophan/tyrosine transport system substrate-binding protein
VAWPLAIRAQQAASPVIGFLSARSAGDRGGLAAAFRRGLNESGFIEGQNVVIEYRWAEFHYDRLPALAAELVRRKVAVIAAISGTPSVLAARAATTAIPIVFAMGSDPVTSGAVSSLSHPGANVTGASFFTTALGAKRLELLRELVPRVANIAILVNPSNPASTADASSVETAAQGIGQRVALFKVSADGQIDGAFNTMVEQRMDGLVMSADPLFVNEGAKLAALTARYTLPAIYTARENVAAGGLMSYGTIQSDAYRQAGVYVGRILKGAKPADLPVVLPTRYELVINLKTAKALGINVPPMLLARADEAIE